VEKAQLFDFLADFNELFRSKSIAAPVFKVVTSRTNA